MRKVNFREPLSKLQILSNQLSPTLPLTLPIKIHSQKLPSGFFSQSRTPSRQPSTARSKQNSRWESEKPSPNFKKEEKGFEICKTSASSRIQMSTDEDIKDNDEQLIAGLINSARSIKRMIRKHSLELRKQCSVGQQVVQLPPLKSVRGKCTAF